MDDVSDLLAFAVVAIVGGAFCTKTMDFYAWFLMAQGVATCESFDGIFLSDVLATTLSQDVPGIDDSTQDTTSATIPAQFSWCFFHSFLQFFWCIFHSFLRIPFFSFFCLLQQQLD